MQIVCADMGHIIRRFTRVSGPYDLFLFKSILPRLQTTLTPIYIYKNTPYSLFYFLLIKQIKFTLIANKIMNYIVFQQEYR